MKKEEILSTLKDLTKADIETAIQKIEEEGIPGNRGSYLYDVVDPKTQKKYPPPYLIEKSYELATGRKLPKGFFDKIKKDGPHFQKLHELGFEIETKWYDDLDLFSKVFSYKWLYTLSTNQWNKLLDVAKLILDRLDLKTDDPKLVVSFRDDAKQRLAVIIGSKYVGGFYIEKGQIYLRFYVNSDFDLSTDSRLSPDAFKFKNKIGKLVYMKLEDWEGIEDPICEQFLEDIVEYYEIAPRTNWKRNHLDFMVGVIRNQGPRRRFLSVMRMKPEERLMEIYKYYLKTTGNKDELYKWEFGKVFRENWNLKAEDFGAMLTSIKMTNLISQQAGSFWREARKNPEEARKYFEAIFDENESLSSRIEWAKEEGNRLLEKWHPGWSSAGQDERTLSVLWAFNDLKKHAPYKSSFYTKYCDLLGMKPASPGEKYKHYLELVNELVQNHISKDKELITLHNATIDPAIHIEDPNYHLLAQNLLYRILDGYWEWGEDLVEEGEVSEEDSQINFWILKANSDHHNYNSALKKGSELDWALNSIGEVNPKKDDNFLVYDIKCDEVICLGRFLSEPRIKSYQEGEGVDLGRSPKSDKRDYPVQSIIVDENVNIALSNKQLYQTIIESIKRVKSHLKITQDQFNDLITMKPIKNNSKGINTILYGPPGTGKTFTLKNEYFEKYTSRKTSITIDQYIEDIVKDLTWWQVITLALIESGTSKVNDLVENRWLKQKANLSESKNVRATIWGSLQMHTIQESDTVAYSQRQPPLIFDKNQDKTWSLIETEAKEQCPDLYVISDHVLNYQPSADKEIKRYVFTTFHQSYSYEDFIEGIKPVMSEDGSIGSIGYRIENGVFKELCLRASNDPDNRYAIFIDEINRGNVSSIFGELITLIEQDKRKGAENSMQAILPYSKKLFSVPSNVDIYGTMNTADRSVEALDTALRRRFTFQERMPKPELLEGKIIHWIDLSILLRTINERIEMLIDRDHTIGHAYLINVKSMSDLKYAFENKIIPLLQEYFYGDYGKIGLVLGEGFVEVEEKTDDIFSSFQYEGRESLTQSSFTLRSINDKEFEDAIEKLFK